MFEYLFTTKNNGWNHKTKWHKIINLKLCKWQWETNDIRTISMLNHYLMLTWWHDDEIHDCLWLLLGMKISCCSIVSAIKAVVPSPLTDGTIDEQLRTTRRVRGNTCNNYFKIDQSRLFGNQKVPYPGVIGWKIQGLFPWKLGNWPPQNR